MRIAGQQFSPTVDWGRTAGLEKGSVIFLHNREEASALKKNCSGYLGKKPPKKEKKKQDFDLKLIPMH